MHKGQALYRETLNKTADRLETTGLSEAASIIREAAEQAESEAPANIARIPADPHKGNVRAGLAYLYRWGEATLEDMQACGVDEDTLAFVGRSGRIKPKRARAFH